MVITNVQDFNYSIFIYFPSISQAINLLQGLIPNKDDKDSSGCAPDHLEKLYVFVVMWSVGAILELEDRSKMQDFIVNHDEFKLNLPTLTPGTEETIFDYFVDHDGESRKSVELIKKLLSNAYRSKDINKQCILVILLKSQSLHAIKTDHKSTGWYKFMKTFMLCNSN